MARSKTRCPRGIPIANSWDKRSSRRRRLCRRAAQMVEVDRLGNARRRHRARSGWLSSGGGIRSATFSLGLMKSLSKSRLVHSIDYLSTVSGGGYAGAFYARACSCPTAAAARRRRRQAILTRRRAGALELGPDVLGSKAGRQRARAVPAGRPLSRSQRHQRRAVRRGHRGPQLVRGRPRPGLALLGFFLLARLSYLGYRERAAGGAGDEAGPGRTRHRGLGDGLDNSRIVARRLRLGLLVRRSGHVPRSRIVRLFSIQSLIALALASPLLFPDPTAGWPPISACGCRSSASWR